MAFAADGTAALRASLQDAVVKCSERCLYQSAKWAAEMLDALPEDEPNQGAGQEIMATERGYIPAVLTPNADEEEAELEAAELNKYLLAKSLFDCREYDRCAAVFLPDRLLSSVLAPGGGGNPSTLPSSYRSSTQSPLPQLSQKSLFLALYAKMISGEKRKDEDSEMVMGPHDLGTAVNRQLPIISRYLQLWFDERSPPDDNHAEGSQGWLEYLYGMVLAKEKNDEEALNYFVKSTHLFPMNWGCWQEMTCLITRVEKLTRIMRHLPINICAYLFHINTSLELYQHNNQLTENIDKLLAVFPTSSFLLSCNALIAYHKKDLIVAEQRFSQVLSLHPHRLDSLDHYSNILYILNHRPKLAFLAHLCSNIDKFRPESCVVIGNYYSLLSMHEKAVQYFRRALTLDRNCLSAWTLMGHEYVELKNTHAAIESYRRAVDVNRRDYRAWYGLGQTYEVLEMHTYALWYYKKAAGLRPWDGKMWMAIGSCLQRMGLEHDGIKALKRALLADSYYSSTTSSSGSPGVNRVQVGHLDPEILLQIAFMYDNLEEIDEAKEYMELCVAQEDGSSGDNLGDSVAIHNDSPGGASDDEDGSDRSGGGDGTGVTAATSKARMWLARYAMRNGDYTTANRLATELCQDGQEVEEAKALVQSLVLGNTTNPTDESLNEDMDGASGEVDEGDHDGDPDEDDDEDDDEDMYEDVDDDSGEESDESYGL